jgi:hypothetical protein
MRTRVSDVSRKSMCRSEKAEIWRSDFQEALKTISSPLSGRAGLSGEVIRRPRCVPPGLQNAQNSRISVQSRPRSDRPRITTGERPGAPQTGCLRALAWPGRRSIPLLLSNPARWRPRPGTLQPGPAWPQSRPMVRQFGPGGPHRHPGCFPGPSRISAIASRITAIPSRMTAISGGPIPCTDTRYPCKPDHFPCSDAQGILPDHPAAQRYFASRDAQLRGFPEIFPVNSLLAGKTARRDQFAQTASTTNDLLTLQAFPLSREPRDSSVACVADGRGTGLATSDSRVPGGA